MTPVSLPNRRKQVQTLGRRKSKKKRKRADRGEPRGKDVYRGNECKAFHDAAVLRPLQIAHNSSLIYSQVDSRPAKGNASSQVVLEARRDLKDRVNANIERLLDILGHHDPIELIAWVSLLGIAPSRETGADGDEEQDAALSGGYQLASVEYLQSLAMARDYPQNASALDQRAAHEALSALVELRQALRFYYALEPRCEGEPRGRRLARLRMIDRTLFVRGEAYAVHVREILQKVHSRADPFLLKEFGFEVKNVLELADLLMDQVEERVNDTGRATMGFVMAYQEFVAWCESQGISESQSTDADIERFSKDHSRHSYVADEDRRVLDQWRSLRDVVRLTPSSPAQTKLAERLSLGFGDNAPFLSTTYGVGWPLNATLVREKPIIKYRDEYFSPDPRILACHSRLALDNLIRECDPSYFGNGYANAKHDATVALVAEKLRRVFGATAVFTHVRYTRPGAPFDGPPEIDVLVVFGSAILAVEVKTGGYEPATRRGAPDSLRDQLRKMLETAQSQVEALHEMLKSSDVMLRDSQGGDLETLRQADCRHWFSMVVTLEDVSAVSTQPAMLSDLGFKWEAPKALILSLPDLLVVTDLLDTPSDFLHYLHRRKAILSDWGVMSEDELDFLMYYIRNGLWFEDKNFGADEFMEIGVFTDGLDEYYQALDRGWEAERPQPQVPGELRQLLRGLERHPEGDAIDAILCMLDCNGDARQALANNIRRSERLTLMGKGPRSITIGLGDRVLLVGCDSKPCSQEMARSLAEGWWKRHEATEAIVVTWVPLFGFGSARALRITRESAGT